VIDSSTITVLDEPEQTGGSCLRDAEIISFELDVAGKTANFLINVAAKQATLADIVPVARMISTKLALFVLDKLGKDGESVPCRKGCSACCNYLIPLSVPEVFCLRREMLAMPPTRTGVILKSCLAASKDILEKKFNINKLTKNGQFQKERLSRWYAGLKMSCPFLSDGLCALYEQRPIACREHIVTSLPSSCEIKKTNDPEVVCMPISVLDVLGQFAADLEQIAIQAVMLPLALPWAQNNLERSHRSWPAVTMVKRFVEILEDTAVKNSTMPAILT